MNYLSVFLTLPFFSLSFVVSQSFAKKNDDPIVRVSFLGTDGFRRKVLGTIQTSKNVDLTCKSMSFFSYYGFSQRCTSCAAECDLNDPSKTCLDKCEGYLVYQKAVAEIKKRDEKIEHLHMLIMGGGIWIAVITIVLVGLIIGGIIWIRYVKKNFEPRHPNQVAPEADRTPMTATDTEENRDDEYARPESGFLSNHSTDLRC